MGDQCRLPASGGSGLRAGTVDAEKPPSIYTGPCGAGRVPAPGNDSKARVGQILKASEIKPFKVKYYCEKRGPLFESKMRDILLVYKQVELQFDENGEIIVPDGYKLTITVSYDEKPGIQAIANTSDGLRPKKGNGEAIPLVGSTHKSSDFIEFLKILDKKYPAQDTIRIILDNHSAHKSKGDTPVSCNDARWEV